MTASWLKTARIFALEAWWPPFWPKVEVDWDRVRRTMERLDLDTLQVNALTKWATCPAPAPAYLPNRGQRDLVAEGREFARRHGYRWILYCPLGTVMPVSVHAAHRFAGTYRPMFPSASAAAQVAHADLWPAQSRALPSLFIFGGEVCLPWCPLAMRSWYDRFVDELVQRYGDFDAGWVDGLDFLADACDNPCQCPTCRREHRAATGSAWPAIRRADDPRLPAIQQRRRQQVLALVRRTVQAMSRGRTVPVVANAAQPRLPAVFPELFAEARDGALFEHAPDQVDLALKTTEAARLVGAALVYPDCYDPWPRRVTSGWEVETKGLTILGAGGTPYLAQPGKYYYDDSNDEPARRVFALMREQRELLHQQQPFAPVGIVSLRALLPAPALEFHVDGARGWTQCALDHHLPWGAFPWHKLSDLTELQRHRALIVSNLSQLTAAQARALLQFVRAGGGLWIEGECGAAREFDLHRPRWTEAQRRRRAEYSGYGAGDDELRCYDVYARWRPGARGLPRPTGAVHPAHLCELVPGRNWQVVADATVVDGGPSLLPLVATRRLGRGRMVWSATPWGNQYQARREMQLGDWMRAALGWLLARPLPITVTGAAKVQVFTTQVPEGWLLYLVNCGADTQGRRRKWWEMMQVGALPPVLGRVEFAVRCGTRVRALYGAEPDQVAARQGTLTGAYRNFAGHAVLHVQTTGGQQ